MTLYIPLKDKNMIDYIDKEIQITNVCLYWRLHFNANKVVIIGVYCPPSATVRNLPGCKPLEILEKEKQYNPVDWREKTVDKFLGIYHCGIYFISSIIIIKFFYQLMEFV